MKNIFTQQDGENTEARISKSVDMIRQAGKEVENNLQTSFNQKMGEIKENHENSQKIEFERIVNETFSEIDTIFEEVKQKLKDEIKETEILNQDFIRLGIDIDLSNTLSKSSINFFKIIERKFELLDMYQFDYSELRQYYDDKLKRLENL